MKSNEIIIASSLVALAFLVLGLHFAFTPANSNLYANSGIISYHGFACVSYYNSETGQTTDYPCHHNLLVNSGKNMI